MALVRLRLGLMGGHLADIFSISSSQVSRIVTTWMCFLSATFKETLLLWPSQEEVRKNLPRSFRRYPNTRIIIDCTEMFIEKATSPYAQRATWSDYKGHNTIKALVGITPSEYFSFLSEFWQVAQVTEELHKNVTWWICWRREMLLWQTEDLT